MGRHVYGVKEEKRRRGERPRLQKAVRAGKQGPKYADQWLPVTVAKRDERKEAKSRDLCKASIMLSAANNSRRSCPQPNVPIFPCVHHAPRAPLGLIAVSLTFPFMPGTPTGPKLAMRRLSSSSQSISQSLWMPPMASTCPPPLLASRFSLLAAGSAETRRILGPWIAVLVHRFCSQMAHTHSSLSHRSAMLRPPKAEIRLRQELRIIKRQHVGLTWYESASLRAKGIA